MAVHANAHDELADDLLKQIIEPVEQDLGISHNDPSQLDDRNVHHAVQKAVLGLQIVLNAAGEQHVLLGEERAGLRNVKVENFREEEYFIAQIVERVGEYGGIGEDQMSQLLLFVAELELADEKGHLGPDVVLGAEVEDCRLTSDEEPRVLLRQVHALTQNSHLFLKVCHSEAKD